MRKFGYARVSTTDQDLTVQKNLLYAAGCHHVAADVGSGASRTGRTALETVLEFIGDGDELVVHRLDRLGRSTRDVLNLVHELEEKGASLQVLEPNISTSGDIGRLVVTVLGMVADLELRFIRERQAAGIKAAKNKGIYKGRKRHIDRDQIERLLDLGLPKAEVARQTGISRQSVYRIHKSRLPSS